MATPADVRKAIRKAARTGKGQPAGPLAWSVFWLAWVLAGTGVELAALAARTPGATLSEQVRKWVTGQDTPPWMPPSARWAARIMILGFFTWLGLHLGYGIVLPGRPEGQRPGPLREGDRAAVAVCGPGRS